MNGNLEIRRAREFEDQILSELAMESKAYWGYSAEFMAACRNELTVSNSDLTNSDRAYFVAETGGEIVGFYCLAKLSPVEQELEALFVLPDRIGQGIGRRLMLHAEQTAAEMGAEAILIQGDPNADRFYRRAGAIRIGEKESESIPGRQLPLYRLTLARS